jgi:hypothetical protein
MKIMNREMHKPMPVQVSPLSLINEDERGFTFRIANDRSGDFILAYRKAGSSSGRHYHTGKSPHKDPEILYLLSGEVVIRWRRIEDTAVREVKVTAPARIEIAVNIWHELVPLADCSFWEMNSLEDVQRDSIRVENQAGN